MHDSHQLLEKVRKSKNQATHYVLSKSSSPVFDLSGSVSGYGSKRFSKPKPFGKKSTKSRI
jgi:hypothetical protein